jgi:DNA-binding MarR family transcriptional regulator
MDFRGVFWQSTNDYAGKAEVMMKKPKRTRGHFPPLTVSVPALLESGNDAEFRKLVDDLLLFATQIQDVRKSLSTAMGLTQPQYNILMILAHKAATEEMTVSEMATRMNVSPPFVVVETNKLEAIGLLHKRPSAVDRRRINLHLTNKAISLATNIGPLQMNVNDRLFGSLSARDFRALGSIVGKLIASYGPALEEARAHSNLTSKRPHDSE